MSVEAKLGGTIVKQDEGVKLGDLPNNRILQTGTFTKNPASKPEIVEGLTNINDVMGHFQPNVTVEYLNEKGFVESEILSFKKISDFGAKAIIETSPLLRNLRSKKEECQKINMQINSNKVLKHALSNQETKAALLRVLQLLLTDLKETEEL